MLDDLASKYDDEFDTQRKSRGMGEDSLYIGNGDDWVVVTRTGDTYSVMFKKGKLSGGSEDHVDATMADLEEKVASFVDEKL